MKRIVVPLLGAVLALTVALTPAVAKTPPGPSTLALEPVVVDAHLGYQKQKTCTPSAKPGTEALLDLLIKTWGGSSWGISRSCGVGGTSEHKEGRALDWHKDTRYASHRAAVADAVKWLTSNNGEVAYRLGIMYIIWDQKIWSIYYQELGWRAMDSRGSRTANHKDHVHISLSWDGAMKQTSWWTGVPVTKPLNSACGTGGARACLPTVRRSSDVWRGSGVRVPAFLPAPWTIPGIGGSPQVSRTLTAVAGTWVPTGATVSYQWLADGQAVPGATDQQYLITAADLGRSFRVRVTARTTGGSVITKSSDSTNDVVKGRFSSATRPVITGSPVTGGLLTVDVGRWNPLPTRWAYQWYRDGRKISGATAASYRLVSTDLGKRISVLARAWSPGFVARESTSLRTAVVTKGELPTSPVPVVSGAMVVGSTLTAERGTWGPGTVTLAQQWYRDGTPIPGARSLTYRLTPQDVGAVVRLKVRGVRAGYLGTERWSVAGDPVRDDRDQTTGTSDESRPSATPSASPTPTPSPSPTSTGADRTPTPSATPAETPPADAVPGPPEPSGTAGP